MKHHSNSQLMGNLYKNLHYFFQKCRFRYLMALDLCAMFVVSNFTTYNLDGISQPLYKRTSLSHYGIDGL